jgi:hypothetical protein
MTQRVIITNKTILLYSIFFFYFTKPKVFATFFLKQVRKKAKNLPHWLYRPFGIPLYFCFASGVAELVVVFTQQLQTSPHA